MLDNKYDLLGNKIIQNILSLLDTDENLILCTAGGRITFACRSIKEMLDRDITGSYLADVIGDNLTAQLISAAHQDKPLSIIGGFCDVPSLISMMPLEGFLLITVNRQNIKLNPDPAPGIEYAFSDLEIRNILTVMFANLEILRKSDLESIKKRASILILNHNLHKLLRIINTLTDLNKSEKGKLSLNARTGDISSYLKSLYESVKPYSEKLGVPITLSMSESPVYTSFDEKKVGRMLLNLISNSLKYTRKSNRINITLNSTANHVIIRISDSGRGIPEELLANLFHRFDFGGESIPLALMSGAGLGIPFAHTISKLHGGSLFIESAENSGTIVTVSLPKVVSSEAESCFNSLMADYSGGFDIMLTELSTVIGYEEYDSCPR